MRVPSAGPDERHTISKMKSTKVECQEITSEGPQVEEIASYSYTIQDESSQKPQNGMLIEEYSESDDNKKKLSVNRGVSIVSVSDDESTLKGLSRDVSTEDMYNAEITDGLIPNAKTIEEKVFEYDGPHHAVRYSETIIEETFIDTSSADDSERKPQRGTSQESKLTKQESKIERLDSVESRRASITDVRRDSQTAILEDSKLSRQSSRMSRVDSTESKASVTELSRRNSQKAVIDDDDDDLDADEKTKSLLKRIKQQRSVLEEIIDQTTEKPEDAELGGKNYLTDELTEVCGTITTSIVRYSENE